MSRINRIGDRNHSPDRWDCADYICLISEGKANDAQGTVRLCKKEI